MLTLKQSPRWVHEPSLGTMLTGALFFILLKRQGQGEVVAVVSEHRRNGFGEWGYVCQLLHCDTLGVDWNAAGWFSPADIDRQLLAGTADLCADPAWVVRHLTEVLTNHPNCRKLFTEYRQ